MCGDMKSCAYVLLFLCLQSLDVCGDNIALYEFFWIFFRFMGLLEVSVFGLCQCGCLFMMSLHSL